MAKKNRAVKGLPKAPVAHSAAKIGTPRSGCSESDQLVRELTLTESGEPYRASDQELQVLTALIHRGRQFRCAPASPDFSRALSSGIVAAF